jgi:hypothetical protein
VRALAVDGAVAHDVVVAAIEGLGVTANMMQRS